MIGQFQKSIIVGFIVYLKIIWMTPSKCNLIFTVLYQNMKEVVKNLILVPYNVRKMSSRRSFCIPKFQNLTVT